VGRPQKTVGDRRLKTEDRRPETGDQRLQIAKKGVDGRWPDKEFMIPPDA